MYICEICGQEADVHHIVQRSQGGYDFKLNYKYLCNTHHRGKKGPHFDKEIDLIYKLEFQNKLYELLPKKYYKSKELLNILELPPSSLRRLLKNLKQYKEGYDKEDIILKLMGGIKYTPEMLRQIELEKLFKNMSIS